MGSANVTSPDGSGQAVKRVVGPANEIGLVTEFEHGQHRPEDLIGDDLHVVLDIGKDRGLDEIALVSHSIAADQAIRTFLAANLDVRHDLVILRPDRPAGPDRSMDRRGHRRGGA